MAYNVDEVFEIAMEIERSGAAFYKEAAGLAMDDQTRRELSELGAMELTHEATFASMRDELLSRDAEQWYAPDSEAVRYLQAFGKGQVFDLTRTPCNVLSPEADIKEVLQYALERERDSVLFYLGIKEAMPESFGKETINHIIHEEMSHVGLLSERLGQLAGR